MKTHGKKKYGNTDTGPKHVKRAMGSIDLGCH
jgi:hypothetical protein